MLRIFAPLEPAIGFFRVGPGVDRFRSQIDAAVEQLFLAAQAIDQVDLSNRGSAPAISIRLALPSASTLAACSIRPLPPVMTTIASTFGVSAAAGVPSVTANNAKPRA
jgi:hypothetical protein